MFLKVVLIVCYCLVRPVIKSYFSSLCFVSLFLANSVPPLYYLCLCVFCVCVLASMLVRLYARLCYSHCFCPYLCPFVKNCVYLCAFVSEWYLCMCVCGCVGSGVVGQCQTVLFLCVYTESGKQLWPWIHFAVQIHLCYGVIYIHTLVCVCVCIQ